MQRIHVMLLLAIVGLATFTATRVTADDLQNDFDRLQGGWTLYYAEWEGASFLPGASVQLLMGNHRYLMAPNTPGATLGAFALYQSSWPHLINFTPLTGPQAGQTLLGIYNIVGNTQVVCFAPPGQPRPTDFTTFPGSGRILNVWLRQP